LKTGRSKLAPFGVREISWNTFYHTSFKFPGTKIFSNTLTAIIGFDKCFDPICSSNVNSKYKYSKKCNTCFEKKAIKLFCAEIV